MDKIDTLEQLFFDELADMLSAEKQILQALPKLIKEASVQDLKDALMHHLHETENQVTKIERIFSILGRSIEEKKCKGMEGILKEGDDFIVNITNAALKDAAIISAAQKVEHYEIASYGTLRSFANHLSLDSKVIDLLQENLDEEGAADKKLTKIAEGSFFFSGINEEAAEKK